MIVDAAHFVIANIQQFAGDNNSVVREVPARLFSK